MAKVKASTTTRKIKTGLVKQDGQVLAAPIENFFEEVGQKEILAAIHMAQAKDDRYEGLLRTLLYHGDPTAPISFLAACKKHGIGTSDIVDIYNSYQHVVGLAKMMKHVPQVLEDVAIDAKSRVEPCPRCDGQGYIIDEVSLENGEREEGKIRKCPLCKGQCEVRISGDKLSRELVFKAIVPSKQGPAVAIQQNFNQPAPMGQAASDLKKILG